MPELIQIGVDLVSHFAGQDLPAGFAYYPIGKFKEFGVMASYIYGHDNYNFRFVDGGSQFAFGLTWSSFPSFQIQPKERNDR